MESKYSIIFPPFPLNFREMSKDRAREYLLWFQEQIPGRISILSCYIRSFQAFRTWEPDLETSSLDEMGVWFLERVSTRKRSKEEMENIYASSPDWFKYIEIPDYTLTTQTFSLSTDIGMYLSQMMLNNIPGVRWELGAKPKNSINYQQPVLAGSGKLVFNPVHIVNTLAYGFAARTQRPKRLKELYEIWANTLLDI